MSAAPGGSPGVAAGSYPTLPAEDLAICEPVIARRVALLSGFYADVPDLNLTCDGIRVAGDHVLYRWTFTGTHAATGNAMRVSGWEEWDLTPELKVASSRGWFDAEDYARQTEAHP